MVKGLTASRSAKRRTEGSFSPAPRAPLVIRRLSALAMRSGQGAGFGDEIDIHLYW